MVKECEEKPFELPPPRDVKKEEAERIAKEEAEAPPPDNDPKFRQHLVLKQEGNDFYARHEYKVFTF